MEKNLLSAEICSFWDRLTFSDLLNIIAKYLKILREGKKLLLFYHKLV